MWQYWLENGNGHIYGKETDTDTELQTWSPCLRIQSARIVCYHQVLWPFHTNGKTTLTTCSAGGNTISAACSYQNVWAAM